MDNAVCSRTSILNGHMSTVTPLCYKVGLLMQRDVKSFDDDDDDGQSDTLGPQFMLLCVVLWMGWQTHTQSVY